MNSGFVDLIYLDPPFNSKRFYSAPIGSRAAGSSFKDMWTWDDVNEAYLETLAGKYPALTTFIASIGVIHSDAMKAYLTYMAQRIIEMHRILKDTGSLYLHCDPTASHYLKIVLDEIFGRSNFRNEITWKRSTMKGGKSKSNQYARNHDVIFYYTKSNEYKYIKPFIDFSDEYKKRFKYNDNDGKGFYRKDQPIGPRTESRIEELKKDGRIFTDTDGKLKIKHYLIDYEGVAVDDNWIDIKEINVMSKERIGYPTQKPLALLHRIIKASSNEGDIVIDPFCGCATTCVAAQQLNRKWIGIDIEKQAVNILIERLSDDAGIFKDFINTTDIPQRTDIQIVEPTKSIKERLYKEQNGVCNGCKTNFEIRNLEIDHIIPKAKGGGDYYENYQLLCGSCNRKKGDRPMEYLRMRRDKEEELLKNKIIFGR